MMNANAMSHTLTKISGEPIWVLTLVNQVEVHDLHQFLREILATLKQSNSSAGVIMDWLEATSPTSEVMSDLMSLIGEWMISIPMSPPVFLVFLCDDPQINVIAETLARSGFILPIVENIETAFSYLSLKIASSQVKDSIRSTQTNHLDPALRLELVAAAERIYHAGQEGDETEKFPARGVLRLEAAGMDKSILVFPEKGGVLGRRDAKGQKPDVDLSLWSGFHSGVSRRHAEVVIGDDGHLYLHDLDSTNGTYLNGMKLDPDQYLPINHGDEIRLGSLVMHLYFQSVSKDG